jgi:hypothetical protein
VVTPYFVSPVAYDRAVAVANKESCSHWRWAFKPDEQFLLGPITLLQLLGLISLAL